MSDNSPLAQALAKLDEAMRPTLGGSADPARRRGAQRLAQLARCEDGELPAFAKRHLPGRAVEETGLRTARDLLLAIDGIADMGEAGPEVWAALAEVKEVLERRLSEAKEAAARRKAEAEAAAEAEAEAAAAGLEYGVDETVTGVVDIPLPPLPERLSGIFHAPSEPAAAPPERLSAVYHAAEEPSPMPVVVRPPKPLHTTANAPDGLPLPAMPFRAAPAAEDGDTVAGDEDLEEAGERTQAIRLPVFGKRALPFGGGGAPAESEGRASLPEAPRFEAKAPVEAGASGKEDANATTGKVRAVTGPVLPFRKSLLGIEGLPPVPLPSAGGPATLGPLPPPHLPPPHPPPHPPAPPPPEPPPRAHDHDALPLLSLSQYASLCAELTVFPEAAEGIFRRYGLDSDERRTGVDAAWKERLRVDPAEYAQWQELYQRYRSLWATQGTPPR